MKNYKKNIFSIKDTGQKKKNTILKLEDSSLQYLKITKDFLFSKIKIEKDYNHSIDSIVKPVSEECHNKGFPSNIYTALYECILNAYQHGNNSDYNKKILFGKKLREQKIEFLVIDEGKELSKMFLEFISFKKNKNLKNLEFSNWYKFSGEKKPESNCGTGVFFMREYMDEVRYFRTKESKGLAVYLRKEKIEKF